MIRRALKSLNLAATLVLLGVLFIMVNYVGSRRYARWDLTKQKLSALSGKTIQALQQLRDPVAVTVFYQGGHQLYGLTRDLLTEYQRYSPKIRVEYVDPEQDLARAKQLVQQYQIDKPNVIVVEAQGRHKHLSDTDLAEYDFAGAAGFGATPTVRAFKGEAALTSAILGVTQGEGPRVWFTTGHGEKALDSVEPDGAADLKRYLEQQNMKVEAVNLLERAEVPAEIKLVVIAGPARRFTEQEALFLQGYLERGGRLLALIDPLQDTGLDGLLAKWGIELGNDVVVDPSRQLPFVSAANLLVMTYTKHPIVEKMQTLMTLYPLARSVRPAAAMPEGLTATPLALTSENGWGETNTATEEFRFDEGADAAGPVSIAVAAEQAAPGRSRLVAIGDSEFIVNAQLGNAGNRDFLLGAAYWLTEQESLIGIDVRPIESLRLRLTDAQLRNVFWFSFLAMPLVMAVAGGAVWWTRRQ